MRHVEVQISATIHLPRGYAPTRELVEDAIKHRLATGENPAGVTLRIVGWNTTNGKTGEVRERHLDDDDDNAEHWDKFRGLLQSASFAVRPRWDTEGTDK